MEMIKKRTIQKYDRHSTVSIEQILPLIKTANVTARDKIKYEISGVLLKFSGLRLQTFAEKGTTCSGCGVKATHFAIERDMGAVLKNGGYHLNLWGIDSDGDEVLFTHDHIVARALFGRDALSNTQTMCCHCNWLKGDLENVEVENLRKAKVEQ